MLTSNLASRCLLLRRELAVASLSGRTASHTYLRAPSSPTINRYVNNVRRHAVANSSSVAGTSTTSSATITTAAGRIFFPSLCILTFGLGAWQTRRYFEKVEMVRKRNDDLDMDPLSSFDDWRSFKDDASGNDATRDDDDDDDGDNGSNEEEKSYRRVRLRGTFVHDDEILIGPRGPPPGALAETGPNSGRGGGGGMSSSAQGYWVVTPLVVVPGGSGTEDGGHNDVGNDEEIAGGGGLGEDVAAPRRGWFRRLWHAAGSQPAKSDAKSSAKEIQSSDKNNERQSTTVWVNRGWIPRHYVNNNNNNNNKRIHNTENSTSAWERPRGVVQLTAMESNTETPGTFSPPSRLDSPSVNNSGTRRQKGSTRGNEPPPNKLLWMDRHAMEEIMASCPEGGDHPPLFVEIADASPDDENGKARQQQQQRQQRRQSFPVRPPREFVGEFKLAPEVHGGYAATWFGLSGAGIVMTRKLLTRGR